MSDTGNPGHRTFTKESANVETPKAQAAPPYLRIPRVPLEWYGSDSWRLPSGKALAEFALQAGFLAPVLFKTEGISNTGFTGRRSATGRPARLFKKAGSA